MESLELKYSKTKKFFQSANTVSYEQLLNFLPLLPFHTDFIPSTCYSSMQSLNFLFFHYLHNQIFCSLPHCLNSILQTLWNWFCCYCLVNEFLLEFSRGHTGQTSVSIWQLLKQKDQIYSWHVWHHQQHTRKIETQGIEWFQEFITAHKIYCSCSWKCYIMSDDNLAT